MEIIANTTTMGRITTRHGDGEVGFVFSTFKRDLFEKNDVFSHLNRYWSTKPLAFQQEVFNIYCQMSDFFIQINDKDFLTKELQKAFKRLFDLHSFEEMRNWIIYNSGIRIPDIAEEYVTDTDRDYTPEKTYVRKEYIDLLTYGFMSRMCVPVWAYYLRIFKDQAGTGLKELKAFDLLQQTYMYDHAVTRKIKGYLEANIKRHVVRSGPMGMLSSDDTPHLRMTIFVVRKLSMVELQPHEPKATIVSLLFGFVKTSNSEGNFQDRFRDKNPHEGGSDGDNDGGNKVSVHERHRNSTDISNEEAVELMTAISSVESARAMLFPFLLPERLEETLRTSSPLLEVENLILTALPCQKTILGWILAPILPPNGIPYQEPEMIVKLMALAEAVLWEKGFHFLSLLMTSRTPQDTSVLHVSSTPFRSRLSDENSAKIRELYPHVRIVQNRKSDPREECLVINAIDNLSSDISEYTWLATGDAARMQQYQRTNSRRLTIPPDIRNDIARLIISLNDKSFYQ